MNVENRSALVIGKKEFGALFNGIQVTGVFPFGYDQSQGKGIKISEAIKKNDQLKEWISFIAQADKCTDIVHGGGNTKIEHIYIFTQKSVEKAILIEKMDDSYSFTEIDDKKALAPTLAYAYGIYVKKPDTWNIPQVDMESYLLIVHLIDVYRRMNYRSLLEYRALNNYRITLDEFMMHYKESLDAKDPRWLLPTFVFFTEVFAKFNLELTDKNIQKLIELGLLTIEKAKNGKEILIFQDALINIAKEYDQHYINSSRFVSKSIENDIVLESEIVFVSHTRKGNHIAELSSKDQKNIAILQSADLATLTEILSNLI